MEGTRTAPRTAF